MVAMAEGILHIIDSDQAMRAESLTLYSDNEAVVKTINKKCQGDSNKQLYQLIRSWVYEIDRKRHQKQLDRILIKHVPAHAKENKLNKSAINPFRCNDFADRLAKTALQKKKICVTGRYSPQALHQGDKDVQPSFNPYQRLSRARLLNNEYQKEIEGVVGKSNDEDVALSLFLTDENQAQVLRTFTSSEEISDYIQTEAFVKILLKNYDNDEQDYHLTIANGLCLIDSLYRLHQYHQNNSVLPPPTNFADKHSKENFTNFISQLCTQNEDIQKSKTLQAMHAFAQKTTNNSDTFSPFPNDDLVRFLLPSIPRMLLQQFERNLSYDKVISSNNRNKTGLYRVDEAAELLTENCLIFKNKGLHFFSSLTPKPWQQNSVNKLQRALLDLSEKILHINLRCQSNEASESDTDEELQGDSSQQQPAKADPPGTHCQSDSSSQSPQTQDAHTYGSQQSNQTPDSNPRQKSAKRSTTPDSNPRQKSAKRSTTVYFVCQCGKRIRDKDENNRVQHIKKHVKENGCNIDLSRKSLRKQ
jgi:ribonuclease HI